MLAEERSGETAEGSNSVRIDVVDEGAEGTAEAADEPVPALTEVIEYDRDRVARCPAVSCAMLEGVKITEDAADATVVVELAVAVSAPPDDATAAEGTVDDDDDGGRAGANPIIIPEANPEGRRTNAAAAALEVFGTEAAPADARPASPSPNELDAGNC